MPRIPRREAHLFRGVRRSFPNPYYSDADAPAVPPNPNAQLPPEHPDFEPEERGVLRLLFLPVLVTMYRISREWRCSLILNEPLTAFYIIDNMISFWVFCFVNSQVRAAFYYYYIIRTVALFMFEWGFERQG
ncbi:hypothetical protein C8J57DRAFT_1375966 [Mycena rebaudengoi]|nr:hypothetical protein C8J57DRAFT_1375966 [Mycena rebaudengoi]